MTTCSAKVRDFGCRLEPRRFRYGAAALLVGAGRLGRASLRFRQIAEQATITGTPLRSAREQGESMTDFALLPAVEIETGTPTDAAVIFLHGLGDDGHGWSDIVPALRLPTTLHIRFLFPHAPDMPVTVNRGYEMPAWYDIEDADFRTRSDIATLRTSRVRVERLIARERHRGIASSRIVLGGFSQGGSLALYVGLRHTER